MKSRRMRLRMRELNRAGQGMQIFPVDEAQNG